MIMDRCYVENLSCGSLRLFASDFHHFLPADLKVDIPSSDLSEAVEEAAREQYELDKSRRG